MSTVDPYARASAAGNRGDVFYGQIQVSASFIFMKKGQRKRAFMEGQDPEDARGTEVEISLLPLAQSRLIRPIIRKIISEVGGQASYEWNKIVWPSLRDCKLTQLKDLDNQWAKVEMVKTGRKYIDATGTEREGTTYKFLALYSDETACNMAFAAEQGGGNTSTGEAATEPADDTERNTALAFIPTLVKQAKGDPAILQTLFAGMPFITKHFTVTSPEVIEEIAKLNTVAVN